MQVTVILAIILLTSGSADAEHLRIGSRQYITVLKPSTQDEAVAYCKTIGARVPTFAMREELEQLQPLLGSHDFWLQGDNKKGGYRFTETGEIVSANLWWNVEPSCDGDCGLIIYTGSVGILLRAAPVSSNYNILCVINMSAVKRLTLLVARMHGLAVQRVGQVVSRNATRA